MDHHQSQKILKVFARISGAIIPIEPECIKFIGNRSSPIYVRERIMLHIILLIIPRWCGGFNVRHYGLYFCVHRGKSYCVGVTHGVLIEADGASILKRDMINTFVVE